MWFIPHSPSKLRSREFKLHSGVFPFTILPFSYPCFSPWNSCLSPHISLFLHELFSSLSFFYCWFFFNMLLWLVSSHSLTATATTTQMKDMTVATSNNHLSLNCCREEKKQTGRVRYISISGCHTRRGCCGTAGDSFIFGKRRVSGIPITPAWGRPWW